jgi:hypothetical protein
MAKALASTKMFYRAKHTFGAFTIVERTNAISPVITSVSPLQQVYRTLTQSHSITKKNTRYNLPTTKP